MRDSAERQRLVAESWEMSGVQKNAELLCRSTLSDRWSALRLGLLQVLGSLSARLGDGPSGLPRLSMS